MTKKQQRKADIAGLLKAMEDVDGYREIWSMYPFREGKLSAYYPPADMPRCGSFRVTKDHIEFVEKAIGDTLTIENLKFFLKARCNIQVVDDLTWRDILTACAKYQKQNPAAVSLHEIALDVLMTMYEAHPKKLTYDDFMFSRDAVSDAMKDLRVKCLVRQEGKQRRNVLTDEGLRLAEHHKNKSLKSD